MRHLKNEVQTIKQGVEGGLKIKDKNVRFQPGDVVRCYNIAFVPDTIQWETGF